jgi:pyruvate/2-oxoglutarate dehydrogenase complex dihydrolipoamide acyltransferase (E2) component
MAVSVVKMSQLSMTMVEGKIVRWLKKEGDAVIEGEAILEVETDKVTVEITAPSSGRMRKIIEAEGEYVQVGAPVCIIAGENEEITEFLSSSKTADSRKTAANTQVIRSDDKKAKISPLARKLAQDYDLDISNIDGTGPGGLIVKDDVEKAKLDKESIASSPRIYENRNATNPEIKDDVEIVPLRGVRKKIAGRLTISKQNAADVTTVAEVDMSKVANYRSIVPASYTAFVVRSAALALQEFPMVNSSLVGEEIHIRKQININVAVATEMGLITPGIRDTDKKNILVIAEEMNALAQKGRDGLLMPGDFESGTFTVTNSGIFGSLFFTPIINYPQCAILGMGKVMKTPVVRNDEITIAPMMYLCLTYDHRIVDGAPAVKFLQMIKHYLENPEEIMKARI